MRNYTIILIFLTWRCWANDEARAINHIQKAVTIMPIVKTTTKRVTKKVTNKLHLDNAYVQTAASVVVPIVKGSISTKDFGDLKYKEGDLEIRPQIDYNIRTGEFSSSAKLEFSF